MSLSKLITLTSIMVLSVLSFTITLLLLVIGKWNEDVQLLIAVLMCVSFAFVVVSLKEMVKNKRLRRLLSEVVRLAETHGYYSKEVKKFIEDHRDVPMFPELSNTFLLLGRRYYLEGGDKDDV